MARETKIKQFELIQPELLKNLSEIQIDDDYFDFHNDYDCYLIKYHKECAELILSFKTAGQRIQLITHVEIIFKDVIISNMTFEPESTDNIMTIDTLYRGRYEEKGVLREFTDDNKGYYYVEFYKGFSFELFVSKIVFSY